MKNNNIYFDVRKIALAIIIFAIAFLIFSPAPGALANDDDAAEVWASIHEDVFDRRPIAENDGEVVLEAPYRAQDAAIVPLNIRIPARTANNVKSLTLIIDKNPAPVVAKFTFGEAAGIGERKISTRVRIDMYSNVRAVIETHDGKLHMATKFVKAAGGCSAPALKDMDKALANLGKMKLRWVAAAEAAMENQRAAEANSQSSAMAEAQIMIKHPNYSGMQMNQLTGLYIPAKFVEKITVQKGNRTVFSMTGGISLSENPNIRFTYEALGEEPLRITATDTDGKTFELEAERKAS